MGTSVHYTFHGVIVEYASQGACATELDRLLKVGQTKGSGSTGGRRVWSFFNYPPEGKFFTLEDAFEAWRLESRKDQATGNIEIVGFTGENIGDEEKMWQAIAPYIRSGAKITAIADGDHWQYLFSAGEMTTHQGRVMFD